jgi:hypothetical protein
MYEYNSHDLYVDRQKQTKQLTRKVSFNELTVQYMQSTEFRCISCNRYFSVKFSPRMNVKLFRDTGGLTPMDKLRGETRANVVIIS